jgi:hypothetical protein
MTVKTSKSEDMCLVNDVDLHIIIFSCTSNLRVLCTQVKDIFIDGTFKCCPKFFEQLYTIHGYSNGHFIPLVFALLVSKSEDTYRKFLQHVIDICSARNLTFKPAVVHVDLEITVHNVFRQMFPQTSTQCCRFHVGQSWWRKIQKTVLSTEYKDNESNIEKWLRSFFGLAFLDPSDVEDCFEDDIMKVLPEDPRCISFADYILESYIVPDSRFPPTLWSSLPSLNTKRATNGAESFHAHYNEQFYAAHPTIFIFLDVLSKIQTTTYVKVRTIHMPAVIRRSEMEKLSYLMDQYSKLQANEIDRYQFVKAIGYKYSAKTDI